MSTIQERIASIGRHELKFILEQVEWADQLSWNIDPDDAVPVSKHLGRSLKQSFQSFVGEDEQKRQAIQSFLDEYEANSDEAIMADPLTATVITISLTSLTSYAIYLWFKVWQTKFTARNKNVKVDFQRSEDNVVLKIEGWDVPEAESPKLNLPSLVEGLKEKNKTAEVLEQLSKLGKIS